MKKGIIRKGFATSVMTFAFMAAVSLGIEATEPKTDQMNGTMFYITFQDKGQDVTTGWETLGVNKNCLEIVQEIIDRYCQKFPVNPETPPVNSETPVKPELPSTPEPETPSQSENKDYTAKVIELVNKERAKEGLHSLTYDTKMEQAAFVRAKEIQNNFSHVRPDGSSFSTALNEAGVSYNRSGENIAWGQKSPEEVVQAWMNSPSHKANIMNGSYSRIGVGYLTNGNGTGYWVQLFAN